MTQINYLNGNGMKGKLWSPVTGCSGKGCKTRDTCWARVMVSRFPVIHEPELLEYSGLQIPFERVQFHRDRLNKPLHWKKPRRIGVCFMGDLFDEQVPLEWLDRILEIMFQCRNHQFFVLTKQSKKMADYFCAFQNETS